MLEPLLDLVELDKKGNKIQALLQYVEMSM